MCSAMARVKLQFATYVILICVANQYCIAQVEHNRIQDCASSCGNIHNITYPFRLNTDPKHCGINKYQLSCENNVPMLYLKQYRKPTNVYQVEAINYNNFTIRLKDPNLHLDNCLLPVGNASHLYDGYSLVYENWIYGTSEGMERTTWDLVFISCEHPMSKSVFQEYNSPCNLTRYWYLKLVDGTYHYDGYEDQVSEMENWCRVEAIAKTSLLPRTAKRISDVDVNNSFAFGFELSWETVCCSSSQVKETIYNCSIISDSLYCPNHRNYNRDTMTNGFNNVFSFFHKLGHEPDTTSVFSEIFVSLNNTLGAHSIYDEYQDLTVFGLILYFLLAIFVTSKLLSFILGPICLIIFLVYKWRRRHRSAYDNIEEFLRNHHNCLAPVRYSYSEIKKITKGFKEKLGQGGYGSVYKGKLRSGRFAAIKMLDKPKADGQDFINEVATIGRIHHVNVVQLIGFCVEGSKRALVFEFMDNGSLDKHIFFKEGGLPINNKMIFDISLGVARGIEYLHQGCDMQILHFDIKPHNILLDEKFIPKISDFGLAKLHTTDHSIVSLTAARGTMGYIAPEFFYKTIGGISYKADVYSFGMLVMEMVGRRKNINAFTEHSSRIYFPSWIYDQFKEGKEIELEDEIEGGSNMVKKMIIVALWCIQLNPINRPSMHKVVEMLEGELEHIKMPPKPFVAPQETPTNDAGLYTNSESSPENASSGYSNTFSLLIN